MKEICQLYDVGREEELVTEDSEEGELFNSSAAK